jgi:hypothetical protein
MVEEELEEIRERIKRQHLNYLWQEETMIELIMELCREQDEDREAVKNVIKSTISLAYSTGAADATEMTIELLNK